jgi:hypothetical protein
MASANGGRVSAAAVTAVIERADQSALSLRAACALGMPAVVPAKAEETTVIKKHRDFDNDRAKVVIKKKEEPREKKVIIHKDY